MHYLNFQSFPSTFSIWKLNLKYTKEILKNTKENIGQMDFSFFTPIQYFYCWLLIVGCIPEDLTVLLTPITQYVHNFIWCMSLRLFCHICHICHIWRIWHIACASHIYDNTGVERSVWTSGMQPSIPNHL